MTPDPAPLAMPCLLANPRRLRRLTQQKSYSSIAFILRICKNLLNAFNKSIEKWKKQIWDQLQSWGYAGCTSSWVSLNLTTCRTKAAWQKPFLPTDSRSCHLVINTPHTRCLLTCLSPWWMIWSYLATHGTIPCDVEDSTAHGSKLTHNHQVYRKPTTIWHPGNETCKANVKKNKTLKKRVELLSLPHLMTLSDFTTRTKERHIS